jgi:hypothetical protein
VSFEENIIITMSYWKAAIALASTLIL